MTRWLTTGPTGEPPAWRYYEPPFYRPKWLHMALCTHCRGMRRWARREGRARSREAASVSP